MPVRIPHATSKPYIGVIRHLGAEIEPIPEVAMLRRSETSWYRRRSGTAPAADDYRPVGKRSVLLLAYPSHLNSEFAGFHRLPKSLV